MDSKEILKELISFPTVSSASNLALVDYCAELLRRVTPDIEIIKDKTKKKANLYASIGPSDRSGVLLSGHTDVVPVDGQNWKFLPFSMTEYDGNLYGRGAADMKGFVACALNAALQTKNRKLMEPLKLALSFDEEVGCVGVRSLIEMLRNQPLLPRLCIVGEPTLMKIATEHKGKTVCRVSITGKEIHSAEAPKGLNAIYLAIDVIQSIRRKQDDIIRHTSNENEFDIPYTTLHVGSIEGGTALNIVPKHTSFMFEIRNSVEENPDELLEDLKVHSKDIFFKLQKSHPEADVKFDIINQYPPLSTSNDADVVSFVGSLTEMNDTIKVSFGTEGGLFNQVGIPTVVCGPGSMAQGHQADEFISLEQMNKCDSMLSNLISRLEKGF
ncbi:MAG: acetylornithine deacetylase [Pseudomonadota bacterium]|nr:acetylornithine deacetylase [Pseudomonadota bacterium]